MKKIISLSLLVLVASMVLSGIPIAEAQSDSPVLLRIANAAKAQVDRQLSQTDNVSEEIRQLFNEGISEVNALQNAIRSDDEKSVKQYFLNAMNIFKKITVTLNRADIQTSSADVAESSTYPQRDHSSNLERLKKLISTLKSIARNQSVDFDQVDRLVNSATKQIRENDREGLKATIDQLKALLVDIQKELRKHAAQTTVDREIRFFNNMINRLADKNIDQELLNDAKEMLTEFEQLIADVNYDETKQLKRDLTQKIKEIFKSIS